MAITLRPARPSNIAPHYLDDVTVADAADLPIDDLASLSDQLAEYKALLDKRAAKLHAALVRRFGDRVQQALASKGNDTGTIHLGEDQFDVSVTTPKKVEWDQAALKAALDALGPEDAKHLAKVKVEIEERKYAAALPKVRAALEPARTVKPGKPTFKITLADEEGVA